MLKITRQSITLTKGDDASIQLIPRYKDKTAYTFAEGDRGVFRIKVGTTLIEKECDISLTPNKMVVSFKPADTINLNPGIYRYEAELITVLGFHYTFIADQTFIIGNEYEQRLTATGSNGTAYGSNLPQVDGEMTDDPVVYGEVQPTNPTTPSNDYNNLANKPVLNGIQIIGNHDNEYYGIPTKVSDLNNDLGFVADEEYVHTDNNYDDTDKGKVDALGTASTYDVAESGNASTSQVVKGDDTRLTDARTPVAHQHTKFDITDFPTNVSAFNNDSGYITNAVNTLINYYLKSETYTKTEVEQLIAAIKQGKFEVVETLPANPDPNVIYLVPKDPTQTSNSYDEYVYINNAWEKIGDTDIDLSGYVTDDELTTALQSYLTTSAFNTAIASYYTQTETDNLLANKVDKVAGKGLSTNDYDNTAKGIVDGVTSALNDKVDKVQGKGLSTNDYDNTAKGIVDGVTSALAGKVDKETGKGLSTNDYTTAEKTKLAGISEGANKVESSSTNGNILIDGTETQVYDDSELQGIVSTDESTIEGNPINFTTKSAQDAVSTIINLEPIQNLHGYDKPWVGGAGKNLLEIVDRDTTYYNVQIISNSEDESVVLNGTANNSGPIEITYYISRCLLKAGTYNVRLFADTSFPNYSSSYFRLAKLETQETLLNVAEINTNYTLTLVEDTNVRGLIRLQNNTVYNNYKFKLMVSKSTDTITNWEPWKNLCPISGRTEIGILGCGKNLFDSRNKTDNRYVNVNGTIATTNDHWACGFNVDSNNNYAITPSDVNYNFVCAYDNSDNFIQALSITNGVVTNLPNNTKRIRWSYSKTNHQFTDNVQVEIGNQATADEPYTKSNDLTISLGQTVYGGTLDVENGVLVVDKVFDELSGGITAKDSQNKLFVAPLTNTIKSWTGNTPTTYAITNYLGAYTLADLRSSAIFGFCQYSDSVYIRLGESITDISDANTYLSSNPLQVCYKLATPITINLTPNVITLLEGVNNISTTADGIKLTYRDGKVATLGDLTSAVDSLDSKIDESKILTDTATGDKYILVVTNGVLSVQQISN